MTKQDKELHEKLIVAKIISESSYQERRQDVTISIYESFRMLLRGKEQESGLAMWMVMLVQSLDWEEILYYFVVQATDLPSCPQRWRDSRNISMEVKMQDPHFREWYNETDKYLDKLLLKYRNLYEGALNAKRNYGSYRGTPEIGKIAILANPIW